MENNRTTTPEILYRNEVFKTPIEELPEKLECLSNEIMPGCEDSFSNILKNGLGLFSIDDNQELQFEAFQQNYYRALHKVVVLHHKFADEGLLIENGSEENTKNLIKFNKIGKRTLVSDFLLPGNKDIIFLSLEIKLFNDVTTLSFFSIKGCPTKVFLIFSSSKYFFSKSNNKRI